MTGALVAAGTAIDRADLVVRRGRVRDVIGLIIEASGLEAEVGEAPQPFGARLGRADHREAVDELRAQRLGMRSRVAQVVVAVVATTHFGHDFAVVGAQPCPR